MVETPADKLIIYFVRRSIFISRQQKGQASHEVGTRRRTAEEAEREPPATPSTRTAAAEGAVENSLLKLWQAALNPGGAANNASSIEN